MPYDVTSINLKLYEKKKAILYGVIILALTYHFIHCKAMFISYIWNIIGQFMLLDDIERA